MVLIEAASEHGGQLRIAAGLQRRREILGIADWLWDQVQRLGVVPRFNLYAEAADVLAEDPDIVVIATGGLPNTGFLEAGEELATTTWDLLSGGAPPAQSVLVFDDNGAHPALSAVEVLAAGGAEVDYVTPERAIAPEIGGTNYPGYFKAFDEGGVKVTLNRRLKALRREGNRLAARLVSDYSAESEERIVDQVVVEHGTLPLDELYFALKPDSSNLGETDVPALLEGRPQGLHGNPEGRFQLFRVGDAVASRNIHAAIYDSLRLCKDF